jgi:hypothetical protein
MSQMSGYVIEVYDRSSECQAMRQAGIVKFEQSNRMLSNFGTKKPEGNVNGRKETLRGICKSDSQPLNPDAIAKRIKQVVDT